MGTSTVLMPVIDLSYTQEGERKRQKIQIYFKVEGKNKEKKKRLQPVKPHGDIELNGRMAAL